MELPTYFFKNNAHSKNKHRIHEFGELLMQYGIQFKSDGVYLRVGEIAWTQGWLFNISVVVIELAELLKRVLPVLTDGKMPFKVVANDEIAFSILTGQRGLIQLGKVLSIYPRNDKTLPEVAKQLVELTNSFRGPAILTDRKLGSVLFTRYGACNPVLQLNERGISEDYIYDPNGNLIKDEYTIPFKITPNIPWPFNNIVPCEAPKPITIKNDLKPFSYLKVDAKGDVQKVLWQKNWHCIKWCVLKEAREYMNMDHAGRDIRDRLFWQYKLHEALQTYLPIPKAYQYYEENNNAYLLTRYIKGKPLDNVLLNIFQARTWEDLSLKDRFRLLEYARQVLQIVECMHAKGYVHRDITPVNFLVGQQQQLWVIDLELAYSLTLKTPNPPFRLGTAGFISPEQQETKLPTVKEDIYAIGGTLISILTGIFPIKFSTKFPNILIEQLCFFLHDKELASTLVSCFNEKPEERPDIFSIKQAIDKFKLNQNKKRGRGTPPLLTKALGRGILKRKISHALNGLATPGIIDINNLWVSKVPSNEAFAYYQSEAVTVYGGLYEGLSGVLLLLGRAHKIEFSISQCLKGYEQSLLFLRENIYNHLADVPAGLYGGTAGAALALAWGVKSGLIADTTVRRDEIMAYLLNENMEGLGIAKGIAGRGLAALQINSLLPDECIRTLQTQLASRLISEQNPDGSWTTSDYEGQVYKVTGFSHGVAGHVCFLLALLNDKEDPHIERSATKALNWLIGQSKQKGGQLLWTINGNSKKVDPGMLNGMVGIALTFIKAFQVLKDFQYKRHAENIMSYIPSPMITQDLTHATGIAGIGELYLEATKIFQASLWQEKADWIAQFLLHRYVQRKTDACYWLEDERSFPTASLMTGNSGIIHFLLRYYEPSRLTHPLMPM